MQISRRQALIGAAALSQTVFLDGCAHKYLTRADSFDTAQLRAHFSGDLIGPRDERYEIARRTQNLAFNRHPRLIARCASTEDVVRVLEFARERHVPIAVRAGGHSQTGQSSCDGGVVIDLSKMDQVSVDPGKLTITCGAGVRNSQAYAASEPAGLTLPLGDYPSVGVAGLTLGGGVGLLSGVAGAACDSLISAEVVLADGRVVTVDDTRDPDLMWALRGAGANFGIVTSLTFRAYPRDKILAGNLIFPGAAARDVLGLVNELSSTIPDELNVVTLILTAPGGDSQVLMLPCWNGDPAHGRQVMDQYVTRAVRPVAGEMIETTHAQFVNSFHDDGSYAYCMRYGMTSGKLPDAALNLLVESHDVPSAMRLEIAVQTLNGVAARTSPSATAFPHFTPGVSAAFIATWDDATAATATKSWSEKKWATLHPFLGGSYVNMMADEGAERTRQAYGNNYPRLRQLKKRYDGDNLFRMNQNIPPA